MSTDNKNKIPDSFRKPVCTLVDKNSTYPAIFMDDGSVWIMRWTEGLPMYWEELPPMPGTYREYRLASK